MPFMCMTRLASWAMPGVQPTPTILNSPFGRAAIPAFGHGRVLGHPDGELRVQELPPVATVPIADPDLLPAVGPVTNKIR
jgi:hypothetical protein